MRSHPGHPRSAFAPIEVVLVILTTGIVAAIAIPRLGGAADRARDSTMVGSAAQLQRAVELYTAEHADLNPVTEPDGSTTTSGATLVFRLMRFTDDHGNVGAGGPFGPYLRSWPTNLYNNRQSIRIDGAPAGANTHGWRIDSGTLKVEADQPGVVSIVGHADVLQSGGGAAVAVGP